MIHQLPDSRVATLANVNRKAHCAGKAHKLGKVKTSLEGLRPSELKVELIHFELHG